MVVNNRIKKGLLLSLRVKKKLKSMNIWQSYKQERGCLVHFARLANALLKTKKVHETIAFLLVTFANLKKINIGLVELLAVDERREVMFSIPRGSLPLQQFCGENRHPFHTFD